MPRGMLIIISFAVLLLSTISVNGLVKLYDSEDFEGLFHQSTPQEQGCVDIPSYGKRVASSLKTDQCLMLYIEENCFHGPGLQIFPGEYRNLREVQRNGMNYDNKICSFHACDTGPLLNVRFFAEPHLNTIILNFSDICGCMNIPLYAHGQIKSLDNQANCIKIYSELGCEGSSVELPGGWGSDTNILSTVGFDGRTKSVSGCGTSGSKCLRLSASVQSFVLRSFPDYNFPITTELIANANVTYENRGDASVEKDYENTKEVDEIVTVRLNPTLRFFYNSKVSKNAVVRSDLGIPILSGNQITSLLFSSYTFKNLPGMVAPEEESNFQRVTTFKAKDKIQIPPCTKYSLTSFVRSAQNYFAEYSALIHVSGVSGDRSLTAAEVRSALGDSLEYIEDVDANTVIARGNGTISASFGIEVVVVGEGIKLPGLCD